MNFLGSVNSLIVEHRGKKVYKISLGDQLCEIGKGENKYDMSHGSFNIHEKKSINKMKADKAKINMT